MQRSNDGIYKQLGIGDCGHVVTLWPMVTDIGGKNSRVICDDCTKEQYGLTGTETFIVVNVVEKKKEPVPKEVRATQARKRTPKKVTPNPFQLLLWGNDGS